MKKLPLLLIASALAGSVFTIAIAHEHAEGVIKERMDAMSAIGAVMGAVGPLAKSGDDFEVKFMKGQAAILNTAMVVLRDGFPEGSTSDVSEASPKIWEDPDGFAEKMGALEDAVAAFSTAVADEDQDAMKAGFGGIGKTCKACHQDYRIETF